MAGFHDAMALAKKANNRTTTNFMLANLSARVENKIA